MKKAERKKKDRPEQFMFWHEVNLTKKEEGVWLFSFVNWFANKHRIVKTIHYE